MKKPLERILARLKREEQEAIDQRNSAIVEVRDRLDQGAGSLCDPVELRRLGELLEQAADHAYDINTRQEEIQELNTMLVG